MQTIETLQVFWPAAVTGLICSFLASVLIVATKNWHGSFSVDLTTGVQKFHTVPTPRIGGIALLVGFLGAWFAFPHGFNKRASGEASLSRVQVLTTQSDPGIGLFDVSFVVYKRVYPHVDTRSVFLKKPSASQ